MHQIILDAIKTGSVLSFNYHGEFRTVEPHCYGRDRKGHDALRAYQINKGWRLFHASDMGPIATGGSFSGPRPNYNPNDPAMTTIYARL